MILAFELSSRVVMKLEYVPARAFSENYIWQPESSLFIHVTVYDSVVTAKCSCILTDIVSNNWNGND